MKKSWTYLLRIVMLAGVFFGLTRLVSGNPLPEVVTGEIFVAHDTGRLCEKEAAFCHVNLSDYMLLPENEYSAHASQEHSVFSKVTGFSPYRRYLTQKTFRDYRDNYRTLLNRQDSLPPIFNPSLEYVSMLRQIVI